MRKSGGFINRYMAHFVSMGLIGLWHGASWNFVCFGLYWGLCISVYSAWRERVQWIPHSVAVLVNLVVVAFGWVLFRVNSLDLLLFPLWRNQELALNLIGVDATLVLALALSTGLMISDLAWERAPGWKLAAGTWSRFSTALALGAATVFLRSPYQVEFIYFRF